MKLHQILISTGVVFLFIIMIVDFNRYMKTTGITPIPKDTTKTKYIYITAPDSCDCPCDTII